MISNIQIQKRRSAHQQVTDWFEAEGLTCDLTQGSMTHWRIGPFPCCIVVAQKDWKSCTIYWSDWFLDHANKRNNLGPVPSIGTIKNKYDLRNLQRKLKVDISKTRSRAFQKIQNHMDQNGPILDPYELVELIL